MTRAWKLLLAVPTYRLVQAAMLVVLGTAFVTSFQSGSAGAGRLGFAPAFTIALPLVCDVVAGVATAIHGRVRRDKDMRRLAAWYVLVPMILSWGANSVDHIYRAGPSATGWPVWARVGWIASVVLAAGICPVAVAGLLHLSTRFVEFEQRQTRPAAPRAAPAAPARTVPAKGAGKDDLSAFRERDAKRKRDARAAARQARQAAAGPS